MASSETTCIATFVGVHGLKGALKARLTVVPEALPATLAPLWLVDEKGHSYPASLRSWELTRPGEALVQLKGYEDRASAQLLRGSELHLRTQSLLLEVPPTLGEVFIGYALQDPTAGPIGTIEQVEDRPGQPLLHVVCTLEGHAGKTILVPLHPDLVLATDEAARTLTLALPHGLLALYLEQDTPNT